MARLLRFVRLDDSFDTQVFTFALPESLPCLESASSTAASGSTTGDFISRDFSYGHQRWRVSFRRTTTHVGASLALAHVTSGMTCLVDFNFTMINREHFTKNDVYSERSCEFTAESPSHLRRAFVALDDLRHRGFRQDNGQFVVELEMRNVKNTFEQIVQLPAEMTNNNHSPWPKVDTGYFSFGGFDWNVSIFPSGASPTTDGRSLVCLARQTSFDHLCRVRYRVVFGRRDSVFESDTIEQMFDMSGNGDPYDVNHNLYSTSSGKGKVRIRLELLSVATIREVELYPLNRDRNRAHLYDRENQAWLLESDVSMDNLTLRLYYVDVTNVPRKFTRFVCWSVVVVPPKNYRRATKTAGSPLAEYFMQKDTAADCYEVTTDIPSSDITIDDGSLLEKDGRMVVQMEWINSHLLYNEKYNRLDEIASRQKHQMTREIMALQAENYALEKQLHGYHISMSRNHCTSDPLYPDNLTTTARHCP